MRALRALASTDITQPLTEHGVWLVCRDTYGSVVVWHAALATLVKRGLAARTGGRGGYKWYITAAGRELLSRENYDAG
ncbi:MAG: hypothetical protein Q8O56_06295 [Solirubrobacteraceae bacterium]|nr:hypothetical protein [Solirubrobacteraceae bacterium]